MDAASVAALLRWAATRIDETDLPQTVDNFDDFYDGARWATRELRDLAEEFLVKDSGWLPLGVPGMTYPEED